jgi:hypothetical protein
MAIVILLSIPASELLHPIKSKAHLLLPLKKQGIYGKAVPRSAAQ